MADHETLEAFVRDIDIERTCLFLGAGAAFPSGAPTASDLARHLEVDLADGEAISNDLAECASILEARCGRFAVANSVRELLRPLKPDGGLQALCSYRWASVFTTNYDTTLEQAFAQANIPTNVLRSNLDVGTPTPPGSVEIFKIHGCMMSDRSFGHRTSMAITYEDLDERAKFRELLFDRLRLALASSTVLFVGYSFSDPAISEILSRAQRLRREAFAAGRVFALLYELDPERARLLSARGADRVARGDINGLSAALAPSADHALEASSGTDIHLPFGLLPCTIAVANHGTIPRPNHLFNGGAAWYGDIDANLTFERDDESRLLTTDKPFVVLLGAAGTGKTTLARRLVRLHTREPTRVYGYEHRSEFPLSPELWCAFEGKLRSAEGIAYLLVDNASAFQRDVNRLVDKLPQDSRLRIVLTAETSAWAPRQKSVRLFREAETISLSRLSRQEVGRLHRLVLNTPNLTSLIERSFLTKDKHIQEDFLYGKCRADMFVCLKAMFSSESIDEILLKEFANIEQPARDVYRLVCALEAAGAIPHRQMVVRLTGISAEMISTSLQILDGLVEEVDRQTSLGIFCWRTRHEVVARTLSRYKYSNEEELENLLREVASSANPTCYEEARTLREMCNSDRGVRGLSDPEKRIALYRLISERMPSDRVARHRIVKELLDLGRLGDAEAEITRGIEEVGLDGPLQRYKIVLAIDRARKPGLLDEDRRAILSATLAEARTAIARFRDNKYMYLALSDAAVELFNLTKDRDYVSEALGKLQEGERLLQDPDFARWIRDLLYL